MARKRRRGSSDAANNSLFLPMELITEILSMLNVKAIVRFKCVSKSWNTLTSDSNFVDKHLKASSRNPHLTICWHIRVNSKKNVVPIPVHRLLKKLSATISSDDFHRMENPSRLVGSCNGLLCFLSWKPGEQPFKYLLHVSNPATRTISQIFEFIYGNDFRFTFGYDASTTTYKIVAFRTKENSNEVKVFNLGGNNCWRNIQNFPIVPRNRWDLDRCYKFPIFNYGVHLNGTINWLAPDKSMITIVIVSLDLSTETYKQFRLPSLGFYHVPISKPDLRVLMDSLCFCHDSNRTHEFILWKMNEYGVRESWTQLFKISYQNLAMQLPMKLPMHNIDYGLHYQLECLYVNGDIICNPTPSTLVIIDDTYMVEVWSESPGRMEEEKHLISYDAKKLSNLG
ncbi:F-box protein [Trifolium pratense]|uniref:F-box protein n=2 Tax=Trifolium pratense TaxID=57577 RepID=A0A2K3L1M5_TRIPR|nr:F-box protein [Trifolium pratense]